MRLITFNTWGGRLGEKPIRDFFEKYQEADVFCLQETWQVDDLAKIDENFTPANSLRILRILRSK